MPVCPTCHTEYGSETEYCETCRTALVEQNDGAGDEIEGTELTELATFPNVSAAEMIKEILDKNGIQTIQRGEVDPIGVASGAEPITLLVEERFLPRARELFEAYFEGSGNEQPPPEEE